MSGIDPVVCWNPWLDAWVLSSSSVQHRSFDLLEPKTHCLSVGQYWNLAQAEVKFVFRGLDEKSFLCLFTGQFFDCHVVNVVNSKCHTVVAARYIITLFSISCIHHHLCHHRSSCYYYHCICFFISRWKQQRDVLSSLFCCDVFLFFLLLFFFCVCVCVCVCLCVCVCECIDRIMSSVLSVSAFIWSWFFCCYFFFTDFFFNYCI